MSLQYLQEPWQKKIAQKRELTRYCEEKISFKIPAGAQKNQDKIDLFINILEQFLKDFDTPIFISRESRIKIALVMPFYIMDNESWGNFYKRVYTVYQDDCRKSKQLAPSSLR